MMRLVLTIIFTLVLAGCSTGYIRDYIHSVNVSSGVALEDKTIEGKDKHLTAIHESSDKIIKVIGDPTKEITKENCLDTMAVAAKEAAEVNDIPFVPVTGSGWADILIALALTGLALWKRNKFKLLLTGKKQETPVTKKKA